MSGAQLAAALGGVLLFLAAGRGLVELLPALRERPLAARLGWSYLLGAAAVPGAVYLLGIAFDVRIRQGVVLAPAILLALAGVAARLLRGRAAPTERPLPPRTGRKAQAAAFAIGAVVVAGLLAEAVTRRESGWDPEMTWNVAARWVRADRSVTPRVLTDPLAYVNHPRYPLLMPLAQVVVQETFATGDDPRVFKPLYAMFFPALLLVFFDLARRHAGTAASALAALALALAPALSSAMAGGAGGAYSDVPLGAFWGAGLALLLGRPRPSEGIAAGLLLAAAVLTKNEGLPFSLVALAAGALAAVLARRADRPARLRALAVAGLLVVLAGAFLAVWKAKIPQRWDEDYVARLRTVSLAKEAAARLPLIPEKVLEETFSWKDWNGLWIVAGVVVATGASGLRCRPVPPVLLALSGCIALYLGALVVTIWPGAEQVHPTWNRLLFQLTVPLGLLLALALRAGLRARAAGLAWQSGADIIPAMPPEPPPRGSAFRREALVFLAFIGLTVAMTWPWVLHLRDYCSDTGDPYLNSWILWWDYHQTFHDPLHLFDGNVFYPMRLSLAFSEHNYGLALPLFPLFALGLRPLTAQGILTLLGFAFSGYGAFRLGRTLTGSTGAGWVAGIAFAFVPYRFGHLPHVNYLFAGWIPILLEAVVLFVRERSPRRAAWLGAAFFLNALTVIHWMVLTLIPLALTALVLAFRSGVERDRAGLKRAALALVIAGIALLPFLLPYQRAAKLYGFTRSLDETREHSAQLHDWMNADPRNKLWQGFSEFPAPGERALFPGLLLLALPLAALLLTPVRNEAAPAGDEPSPPNPRLLRALDAIAVLAGFVAAFAASPAGIHLFLGGKEVFRASDPSRALTVLALAVLVRWWLAYPAALPFVAARNIPSSLRRVRRSDAIAVGWILVLLGFFGSFGVRFPFHRILFETVFLFRSVRVPARWSMIAYLGLALLAGAGALALAEAWNRRRRVRPAAVCALACLALLFEDRAAPLELVRGEADPDDVTRYLAKTPMKGGLVELPAGTPDLGNYRAMLRAADHGKPLITAVSGFYSPIVGRIESDTKQSPIPEDLLDFLEGIPTSYLVVHDSRLRAGARASYRAWLDNALASGRLVFVKRFDGEARNDLFALARNEPLARSIEPLPWAPDVDVPPPAGGWKEDATLTGSLDEPTEGAIVHGTLRASGWARVSGEDLLVTLLIDGGRRIVLSGGRTDRAGVCAVVEGLGDCSTAGYEATFAFTPGDEGPHTIVARFRSKDGRERHYPPRRFVWRP